MRRWAVLAGMVMVVWVPGAVHAQSDGYAFTGINFNFTNPGARARGIGGAFVAIADDSTAALANPAGLAYLDRQVTLEWIRDEEKFPVGQLTQGGVTTSTEGFNLLTTPIHDPYRVQAESKSDRLNHGSIVLPLMRNRMTLALSYGVLAELNSNFEVGDSVVCVGSDSVAFMPGAGQPCVFNVADPASGDIVREHYGQRVSYSMKTDVTSAAVGYRLNDRWSVGGEVGLGRTVFDSRALIDHSVASEENQIELSTGRDQDLLYTVGVIYRADLWGFGASWRSASRYRIDNDLVYESGPPVEGFVPFSGELTVPERMAVGVVLFPSDAWVIAAEATRIPYSDVLSKMSPFDAYDSEAGIDYRIEDSTELHLGAEYTRFTDRRGWSLRAGWWRDQRHLPYVDEAYGDPRQGDVNAAQIELLRAVQSLIRQRIKQDVDHFTAGIGLSSGVVRVDAAVDWSDKAGTDFLVSGVFYF